MATSGSFQSSSYGNSISWRGEIKVNWESKPTSDPGKTQVNWTIYTVGREGLDATGLYTTASVTINGSKVWSVNNELVIYNNKKQKTGEFEVEHNTDGTGNFEIEIKMSKKYSAFAEATYKSTIELDANYPYTSCYWDSGATVTINQTYIKPIGDIKIEWSGAKQGTSNSIAGYRVEYSLDDGAWSLIEENTTENSILFNPECQESDRGKSFKVRVKILSKQNEIYNSTFKESATSYINPSLGAPIILDYDGKNTEGIVAQGSKEVNITCQLPTKSTNQKITLQWATDEDFQEYEVSESTNFTVNLDFENSEPTNIYIRAWDGVENSTSQHITIIKNDIDSYVNVDRCFNLKNYSIIYKPPTENSLAAEKFSYTCQLFHVFQWEEEGETEIKQVIKALTNETQVDIRSLINPIKSGITYHVQVYCGISDGVDTLNKSFSFSFQSPTLEFQSNGELGLYFQNSVSVTLTFPEGASEHENGYWKIAQPKVNPGDTISQIKMYDGSVTPAEPQLESLYFLMEASNSITKIKDLELDLSISNNPSENFYKPYTSQLVVSGRAEGNWKQYGLTSAPSLIFYIDQEKASSDPVDNGNASTDNTIKYSLSKSDSYAIAQHLATEGTDHSVYLYYKYTNFFGETVELRSSQKIQIDFTEQAYSYNNNNKYWIGHQSLSLDKWSYIIQGMHLTTSFQVAAFSKPTAYLQFSSDGITWTNLSETKIDGTSTNTTTNDSGSFNVDASIYKFDGTISIVGRIQEDMKNCQIRIVVETNSTDPLIEVFPNPDGKSGYFFRQHTEPQARFTSLSYDTEGIQATYKILDWGCSKGEGDEASIQGIVRDRDLKLNYISIIRDKDQDDIFFGFKLDEAWDYIYIAPEITTYIYTTATNSQGILLKFYHYLSTPDSDLEYLICYNISPTVSYRQNHIGINTNQIDESEYENAVAIISQYNNRGKIYFSGVNNGSNLSSTLDLTTMGLLGFVVDCGSWSGVPGGIIPNPNTPDGLAQIAYTGQIYDLQQTEDYEVILEAGGAPI